MSVQGRARWVPWLILAVLLGGALTVAARSPGSTSRTAAEAARVRRITSEIRCPTCKGLSAAESDAATAKAIVTEVTNQVRAGRTDGEIFAFMRDHYGGDILLRPPASGIDGLVWGLPVAAFVLALAGLVIAFRRWKSLTQAEASDADRKRVARELGG
jgi:cytochrome c-type biogenesis protein CcmH